MKTKKFFACMVCVVAMGLTACAGGEDDSAGIQTLQPEQSDEEETNDRQEDIQETEQDKNEINASEVHGTEAQQSETQQPEAQQPETPGQNSTDEELEKKLAEYRAERETMTNVAMGNGVSGYGAPNAENYGFQTDTAAYTQNFDSRELNKAFEAAKKYVEEVLSISVETNAVVYSCIDPRITEIYEVEDKGVASGYKAENIFVCEYCDSGTWQYLILVREGKDSDWSVIHHGSSYIE